MDDYKKRIHYLNQYIENPPQLIKDFTELAALTTADLDKCVDISNSNLGDQSWQRLAVRTAFSAIDSVCYKLKELVYCTAKHINLHLSERDEDLLLEFKKDKQGVYRK